MINLVSSKFHRELKGEVWLFFTEARSSKGKQEKTRVDTEAGEAEE